MEANTSIQPVVRSGQPQTTIVKAQTHTNEETSYSCPIRCCIFSFTVW